MKHPGGNNILVRWSRLDLGNQTWVCKVDVVRVAGDCEYLPPPVMHTHTHPNRLRKGTMPVNARLEDRYVGEGTHETRRHAPTAGSTTTFFKPRKKQILCSGGSPTALTRCTVRLMRATRRKKHTQVRTVTRVHYRASGYDAGAFQVNWLFVRRILHTDWMLSSA
jgi:hypothetical protein